ncbi:hypothetical protein C4J81_11275 [Deltaproteobacteria bacterium Smac51]|nr:hypothetical protein C4J81_11275 [Deltaproteobacteria bacterium Smac51]
MTLTNFNKTIYSTEADKASYRFPFQIDDERGLRVIVVDPADLEQVPLFLAADYTVDSLGQADGGTITLTATGLKKAAEGLKLILKKAQAHECSGGVITIDGNGADISEEEMPVGIDYSDGNRVIYQKTIACGAIPSSNTKYVPHNVTGFRRYWVAWAYATHTQGWTLPLPLAHATASYQIYLGLNSENVQITTWCTYWTTVCKETYVTIRYTKE